MTIANVQNMSQSFMANESIWDGALKGLCNETILSPALGDTPKGWTYEMSIAKVVNKIVTPSASNIATSAQIALGTAEYVEKKEDEKKAKKAEEAQKAEQAQKAIEEAQKAEEAKKNVTLQQVA